MNSLLIAVLAGLAGMIGWGCADFFAKKTIDEIGDMASLAWAHIFGSIFIFALVVVKAAGYGSFSGFPSGGHEMAGVAFFGALQALVYFFAYRAFGKGKLALLNPIFSTYSAWVVVLSILLFGEVLGLKTFLALVAVFLGIMLINLDEESWQLRKLRLSKVDGLGDMLAAVALATVWTAFWGHFVQGKDWMSYSAFMYFFMSITVLILCWFYRIKLVRAFGKHIWQFLALIGLAEVIAYVGVSYGYSLTTHLSIVAVLSSAFSVPTLLLAHLFLKERITRLQLTGVAAVVAGVVLISLL